MVTQGMRKERVRLGWRLVPLKDTGRGLVCQELSLILELLKTFYFEVISDLQKCCKIVDKIPVILTQLPLMSHLTEPVVCL